MIVRGGDGACCGGGMAGFWFDMVYVTPSIFTANMMLLEMQI